MADFLITVFVCNRRLSVNSLIHSGFPLSIRRWLYVFLLLVSVGKVSADNAPAQPTVPLPVKQDVKVIVSTDNSEYVYGDPVLVHVVIQNFGSIPVTHLTQEFIRPAELIVVRTENGVTTRYQDVPAPMTEYARFYTDQLREHSGWSTLIPPGRQESYTFLLNQSRDVTLSGPYKVTMIYKILPNDQDDKAYFVTSNTATFTVTFGGAKGVTSYSISVIDAGSAK